jgi:hypothetical protein
MVVGVAALLAVARQVATLERGRHLAAESFEALLGRLALRGLVGHGSDGSECSGSGRSARRSGTVAGGVATEVVGVRWAGG